MSGWRLRELYEKRREDWNRWQEYPWANGAYPAAHWDALDHLDQKAMSSTRSGFPIEATWARRSRLTLSDVTNILSISSMLLE